MIRYPHAAIPHPVWPDRQCICQAPLDDRVHIAPPPMTRTCPECDRTFDMLDADDAAEWSYGHDCEPLS